jgi:hypothetical protein
MRRAKGLARKTVQEVAGDRFARREGDRVDEAVELVPVLSSDTSQSKVSLEPNSAAVSAMRSLKRSPW